ncbi:AAA family ATPase [Cardinium endosymbiont of Culicoides punctatus]|uniref:AAA family ATPase n=1 Tax=Cardinium endosymbiont of Culicoides punctatus TaxID=2304601 RepID=UPI001058D95B|nr:AAA family ATPase [Cardinium endosymbiont of Culicoides punctatus]TDG95760.1 hypothetical protein CCPUN_00450 [Cardinium endosymbiont of Culicoides punctatus]
MISNKKNKGIHTCLLACLILSVFACNTKNSLEAKGVKRTVDDIELERCVRSRSNLIPIGDASIQNILDSGFYADKTKFIGSLLMTTTGKSKVLIRPRRFGKSALISTIATIAEGEISKTLFEGCYIHSGKFKYYNPRLNVIEKKTYDWKKYPVIRLDFSQLNNKTPDGLEQDIMEVLDEIASRYNIVIEGKSYQAKYRKLLNKLITLKHDYEPKVIVLIDEYDSPMIKFKFDSKAYNARKEILASFYKIVKSCAKDCKLIFLTGVTNFSLSDLESGPNNIVDISLSRDASSVAGYTEEDVRRLFAYELEYIAKEKNKVRDKETTEEQSIDTVINDLKDYYDGYQFSQSGIRLFNPTSILYFFKEEGAFRNYWYKTGDPTLLLKQIQKDIDRFTNVEWDKLIFKATTNELMSTEDNEDIDLIPLMYQTGYLTIDSYNSQKDQYILTFPNQEVRESLHKNLAKVALKKQKEYGAEWSDSILKSLHKEKWHDFLLMLYNRCFSNTSYLFIENEEKSFHRALYLFLVGACHDKDGITVSVEEHSGSGRPDIVINDHNHKTVYILELKKNGSANEALQQIEDRNYDKKYHKDYKRVINMGLNCIFDTQTINKNPNHRNINESSIVVKRKKSNDSLRFLQDNKQYFERKDGDFVLSNKTTTRKGKTRNKGV